MISGLGAYYRPDRLEDALALLAADPRAEVLAGGTDLLIPTQSHATFVDLAAVGLDALEDRSGEGLVLGATLRVQTLLESRLAARWADGVLVGACLEFGTVQVRNAATVGGNVAHALPAADLVPALMALDAEVECARGADPIAWRRLPLDGFATGPFRTVLLPGEIVARVCVPAATRTWRAQFRKVGRVLKDLAQVNACVALDVSNDGVRTARVVLGAVHPTVVRVGAAEAELAGGVPAGGDWAARVGRAVDAVRSFVQPISDVRATAAWRRHVAGVLVERCVAHCVDPHTRGRVPRLEDGPSYAVGLRAGEVS